MKIKSNCNREDLECFLSRDPLVNIEALAMISKENFTLCRSWLSSCETIVEAVCIFVDTVYPLPVFISGTPKGVRSLANRLRPLWSTTVLSCDEKIVPALEEVFEFTSDRMIDIMIWREAFSKSIADDMDIPVKRLTTNDIKSIQALFVRCGEDASLPAELNPADCFGVFAGGGLASLTTIGYQIGNLGWARLGAVMTDPSYRGRGFASATCRQALRFLSSLGYRVSLKVEEDNFGALKMYQSLGFKRQRRVYEGLATVVKSRGRD